MIREVEEVARELLLRAPFYGHLALGLERSIVSDERAPAVALVARSGRAGIAIGAKAWLALSPALRRGALKHALLHLAFKHPSRAHAFQNPIAYALAADLVIEPYLPHEEREARFITRADLGFPPGDVFTYYTALLSLLESGSPAALCAYAAYAETFPSCDRWDEFRAMGSATRSVLEANIDFVLRSTRNRCRGRAWGSVPGDLVTFLESLDRPAELPWRRMLRLFTATSERTRIQSTVSRPSKRYGTTPGIRVRRHRNIVVAIDTSGSIGDSELRAFFAEIHAMWKRGAIVTIVECDAGVAREYPYRGRGHSVVGGGGTSFDPAILRANALAPDALVYLTDGWAPPPRVRPRMPVLWVLSATGRPLADAVELPGRRVQLARL